MINVEEKIKEAMKGKNREALKAWQNFKAEIQKFKTAKNAQLYDETAEIKLLGKYCKTLEDAISQFIEAKREDLAAEYTSELEILKPYLPKPISLEDVEEKLINWCKENNFISVIENQGNQEVWEAKIPKKKMGDAIKYLKSTFPTLDGKSASDLVKKWLE